LHFAFSDFAWSVLVVSDVWALAVNPLGGLIIFRMLGVYDDSSGTLIPALRVPLDFYVVKCTLVLHSSTSGRVIPLFKGRCSADDLSPLIAVVAGAFVNQKQHDSGLELPVPGAKRGCVLIAFLDSDEVIRITEVLSSISGITGRWIH